MLLSHLYLKTTEVYLLAGLEDRSPVEGCGQGQLPPGLWRGPFLAFSPGSVAPGGPRFVQRNSSLCSCLHTAFLIASAEKVSFTGPRKCIYLLGEHEGHHSAQHLRELEGGGARRLINIGPGAAFLKGWCVGRNIENIATGRNGEDLWHRMAMNLAFLGMGGYSGVTEGKNGRR